MARRKWFQFSLKTMMVAVVVLGLAFVRLEKYLSERPIDWQPFSLALLQEQLAAGSSVLVYFRADWDADSFLVEEAVLETPEMRRAVLSDRVVAMRADFSRPSKESEWAWEEHGWQPTTLVLFRPWLGQIYPTVIEGFLNKGKVIGAIHDAARRKPDSS